MRPEVILDELNRIGAIVRDTHVVYTSGLHGDTFVNKDGITPYTHLTEQLCRDLAVFFWSKAIDAVIAPAVGGIALSQWTAHYLTNLSKREVAAIYADKTVSGDFVIKRGFPKFVTGKRVLVVEDVLTTGGSAAKVVRAVENHGGTVVGVGALCNRGGVTAETLGGVPEVHALLNLDLNQWTEENCPLCKREIPVNTEVGHGREFLERQVAGREPLAYPLISG